MNYFVLDRASNLVVGVIASSFTPTDSQDVRFIKASDKALDSYYKLLEHSPGIFPDIGQLMAVSPYTLDIVTGDRSGTTKPVLTRLR
ncbi:hypothetical protein SAMN05216206_2582 [Pseudomonas guineae]|uniref:Uncharacterized protein n=1 Tax=Pseudomonas guineae TaxID=425504 RepID=A0A1I3JR59_9PSED|nr:hypothetical protein SAMN05216206_2582 [Pseudomonas guineae]